nr:M6 family metalloprotease domain-containing protein [Flavobacteriales bacterium]
MNNESGFQRIPPAPDVLAQLYAEYLRKRNQGTGSKLSFKEYLARIGFVKKEEPLPGRDMGRPMKASHSMQLVSVPKRTITGRLNVLVLLVDFDDNPAFRPKREYEDMLFSNGSYLTGSLRDYYKEVSNGKVTVGGTVHGWYRMPKPYAHYVGDDSGCGTYPTNAQALAQDALKAALRKRVAFPGTLDKLGNGSITALVIVHAGRGAEVMTSRPMQRTRIWSHKGDMPEPFKVKKDLFATNYLTVLEDCRMGVCAHELGHLAFQWDDFYDPNYDQDGSEWAGAGNWDLMAGGSWNDGGNTPARPAGLHLAQHKWVKVVDITATKRGIKLPPYDKSKAVILRVRSEAYSSTQCLIIEN